MESPLISVIIPVHKVEQYIDRCVKSVVNQTYRNLEIILIDDGSPDNCPEICEEWARKDKRIKIIHKENEGVSVARNRGIDIATGDYVGFVDSDDWISEDMFEVLLENALKYDADISHCSFYKAASEEEYTVGLGTGNKFVCDNNKGIEECLKLESFILSIWNKLYKKKVLEGVRFEIGRYISEDTLFNFMAFKNAKKTIYDGDPKYYYFTRSDSAINSSFSRKNLDVIYFTDRLCALTKEHYPDLLEYAERRDIVENILMINDILNANDTHAYSEEYKAIMSKLKAYSKTVKENTKVSVRYKLLLAILIINENAFSYLLSKYLAKKR